MRALARRLEGKGATDAALRAEVEQLQQRLGEVDTLHQRVAELEERLDFAERMLARRGRPARCRASASLMLLQAPVPPVPPVAPGSEIAVAGSLEDWRRRDPARARDCIVAVVLWPLIRAIARRIEGGAAAAARCRRSWRSCASGCGSSRSASRGWPELEERLDFAERIAGPSTEPDRLKR